MAPRQPYQEPRISIDLRAQAAPTDTFVNAPQVVRDNSLSDLAQGLSKLDAGLGSFLQERKAKQDEEDKLQGEIAFHKNNREGYAEAVASGRIPAYASKSFVESYKRTQGSVAGYDLEQRFQAAYDGWDGKGDPDPAKFDAFLGGFLKENIKTEDPDVLRGLVPRLRALTENAVSKSSSDRHKALVNGNALATGAQANIAVDEAHARGLAQKKGTDYNALFGNIEATRAEKIAAGANPADIDNLFIDALTAKAIEKRDPKLLDFLERKVPGKDYTWAQTPYGQVQKGKTIEALESLGRKGIAEEEKRRKELESKERDDTTRLAIESLAANPDAPFPEQLMERGTKVEPEFRTKVNSWRDNIRKNQGSSSPEALKELTWELMQSGGRNTDAILRRGMETGILANKEDLTSAYKLAEDMKKAGAKVEEMRKSSAAGTIRSTIKQRTLSSDDLANPFAPEGLSDQGLAATYDFDHMLFDWAAKNPNASPAEQEEAVAKIGSMILGRVGRADGGTGAATYSRDGLSNQNSYQGPNGQPVQGPKQPAAPTPTAPPAPAPAQPQAPAQGPSTQQIERLRSDAAYYEKTNPEAARQFRAQADQLEAAQRAPQPQAPAASPAEIKAWFDTLPPATQKFATDRAFQTGKPISEIVGEAYLKQRQQTRPSEPPAPAQPQRQGAVAPEGATTQPASILSEVGAQLDAALANFDEEAPANQEIIRQVGGLIERAFGDGQGNTGSYTLAALKDDPKAAKLLDFIAGPESGGNYNAWFAKAKSTEDLSKYTVDGILARQQAERRAGAKSTAAGRYQIIYKTMLGLKKQMGLTGSEPFTPELQDRMALQLLRTRGYDRFREGKMSLAQFSLELAKEWASLPDPSTGRSFYAGDGLNKSHRSPTQVAKALGD